MINPAVRLSFQPNAAIRCEIIHRGIWLASERDAWPRGSRSESGFVKSHRAGDRTTALLAYRHLDGGSIDGKIAPFKTGGKDGASRSNGVRDVFGRIGNGHGVSSSRVWYRHGSAELHQRVHRVKQPASFHRRRCSEAGEINRARVIEDNVTPHFEGGDGNVTSGRADEKESGRKNPSP